MIEDNDSNAYLARFLLEQRGHSVEVVAYPAGMESPRPAVPAVSGLGSV